LVSHRALLFSPIFNGKVPATEEDEVALLW
jgi:hypothetical protein